MINEELEKLYQKAKQKSMLDLLARKDIYPDESNKNNEYRKFVKLRDEGEASVKIDLINGLWVDYGNNMEGGDIIDLAAKIYCCSKNEAVKIILVMDLPDVYETKITYNKTTDMNDNSIGIEC
jgi:hypothetical protein